MFPYYVFPCHCALPNLPALYHKTTIIHILCINSEICFTTQLFMQLYVKIYILFTYGVNFYDYNIPLTEDIRAPKSSLVRPHYFEVHVPAQSSVLSCACVLWVSICFCLYDRTNRCVCMSQVRTWISNIICLCSLWEVSVGLVLIEWLIIKCKVGRTNIKVN